MTEVKFINCPNESQLKFAVVIARMGNKWVLCKHKDRTTFEFPGGHREKDESIVEAAKRELQEETGAVIFSLERICDYSVRGNTRDGEVLIDEVLGTLFYAKITARKDDLHSEIEKVVLMDDVPNNWTYPLITPKLIEKALSRIMQDKN